MPQQPQRVRVEELDWFSLFPFLKMFRSFRMAIQPGKLVLAFVLIALLYLVGRGMDLVWGDHVIPGEYAAYTQLSPTEFDAWIDAARASERSSDMQVQREGIFASALHIEMDAWNRMFRSAVRLDLGLPSLIAPPRQRHTTAGALYELLVLLPGWMLTRFPVFTAIIGVISLLLFAIFGGALARLCAVHATQDRPVDLQKGLDFVRHHGVSFGLAPVLPCLIILALAVGIATIGLLFNWPATDILASLVFLLSLLMGLAIALLLVGLLIGGGLLYPAVAVDGADVFDAMSRAGSYIVARPWKLLFYWVVAIVYGSITILFVGGVLMLALYVTQRTTGWWVFREATDVPRFDAIMPVSGQEMIYSPNWKALGASGSTAAAIVAFWSYLLISLFFSYCVSLCFTLKTWIYLLLRNSTDGGAFDELYVLPAPPAPASPAPTQPAKDEQPAKTEQAEKTAPAPDTAPEPAATDAAGDTDKDGSSESTPPEEEADSDSDAESDSPKS